MNFMLIKLAGLDCRRVYQRENEERPIHRDQFTQQHVRTGRTPRGHLQGQSYDEERHG